MDITFDDEFDFYKHSYKEISLASPEKETYPLFFLSQMPLAKRITTLSVENSKGTFLVDGLIRVTGPSDAFRISAINHWEAKKENANWWWKFNVVLIVGSAALLLFPPLLAFGAVVFIGASYRATNYAQIAKTSQKQIDKWTQHPAQAIADERSRAYIEGFFYVMNHHLKGSYSTHSSQNMLHPFEVMQLYEKALKNQMNEVSTQLQRQNISVNEKRQWVEQFIAQNPLSLLAISYAYEANDPKRQILEPWAASFSAYKQDVTTAHLEFKERKANIQSRAKDEIRQLEEQRNLDLNYPLSLKRASDEEAKNIRNEWAKEDLTEEEKKTVEENYKKALSESEALYKIAAKPINFYYDERIQDVKSSEAVCLQEIEEEKNLGISPYFEPGLRLFADAFESWQASSLPTPSAPARELLTSALP